jgi:hypothetical protein
MSARKEGVAASPMIKRRLLIVGRNSSVAKQFISEVSLKSQYSVAAISHTDLAGDWPYLQTSKTFDAIVLFALSTQARQNKALLSKLLTYGRPLVIIGSASTLSKRCDYFMRGKPR